MKFRMYRMSMVGVVATINLFLYGVTSYLLFALPDQERHDVLMPVLFMVQSVLETPIIIFRSLWFEEPFLDIISVPLNAYLWGFIFQWVVLYLRKRKVAQSAPEIQSELPGRWYGNFRLYKMTTEGLVATINLTLFGIALVTVICIDPATPRGLWIFHIVQITMAVLTFPVGWFFQILSGTVSGPPLLAIIYVPLNAYFWGVGFTWVLDRFRKRLRDGRVG
jgi:hypothetical protein